MIFRIPSFFFLIVCLTAMQGLSAQLRGISLGRRSGGKRTVSPITAIPPHNEHAQAVDVLLGTHRPRLVVAHFMLGNTYPFTESDWHDTFKLAVDTKLDALALNLGPEEWQIQQASLAYSILSNSPDYKLKLFLSLDMNVLPGTTLEDARKLLHEVAGIMSKGKGKASLRWGGGLMLSTFRGHAAEFGGLGWAGWLESLKDALDEQIFFMPAFFIPPNDFINLPHVNGTFAWNNAWPTGDLPTDLSEDEPFLNSDKPYMAAVSPLFSTHYGSTGQWAFNKNWIYRSDDLLLPTRFTQLLSLPPALSPSLIQIISWNDHGESHSIAPVLGAQPGSEGWTDNMPHEAFREMTRYFISRWRDGVEESELGVGDGAAKVWGWWRVHGKGLEVGGDEVGRPGNADWAQDLLNFVAVTPQTPHELKLHVQNGPRYHVHSIESGRMSPVAIPFVPGEVRFKVTYWVAGREVEVVRGEGRGIAEKAESYNFNMWSGCWDGTIG